MPVRIAMPIGHQENPDYTRFDGALRAGRPFRQPLQSLPDKDDFSDGLELIISDLPDLASLFAMFDGALSWRPSPDGAPSLVLTVDPDVYKAMLNWALNVTPLPLLYGPPGQVVYENVDEAATKEALIALLEAAYTAAADQPSEQWHPMMRIFLEVGDVRVPLKEHLDTSEDLKARIATLVNEFIAGMPGAVLREMLVLAGDKIGVAAYGKVTEEAPPERKPVPRPELPWHGDIPDPPRCLNLKMLDNCGRPVNPLHYLHVFLHYSLNKPANPVIEMLTAVEDNGELVHPLVELYPELKDPQARPGGWERVDGQIPVTIGKLADFHAWPRDNPISNFEWRYNEEGFLEARRRADQEPVSLEPGPYHRARMEHIWESFGEAIANAAEVFQIPCEVIAALVATESPPDLDERAIRLEPFRPVERTRLIRAGLGALEMLYDQVVGIPGRVINVVDNGDGTSTFDFILEKPRTWSANFLRRVHRLFLNKGSRFEILAHSAGINTTRYKITVRNADVISKRFARPAHGDGWILYGYSTTVPDPWDGTARVREPVPLT